MKKVFLYTLTILTISMVSCQKETGIQNKVADVEPIVFTASLDTKTTIGETGSVTWNSTDKIRLHVFTKADVGNYVATQTYSSGFISAELGVDGTSSASFKFYPSSETERNNILNGDYFHAIYPYTVTVAGQNMNKWTVSTDNDREYFIIEVPVADNLQDNDNVQIRIATSTSTTLAFKNALHLIRFETKMPGAKYAKLSAIKAEETVCKSKPKYIFDGSQDIYKVSFVSSSTSATYVKREIVSGYNYFGLTPGLTLSEGFQIQILDAENAVLETYRYDNPFTTTLNKLTTIKNFDSKTDLKEAILLSGPEVNVALKNLAAGVDNCTTNSNNQTIKEVRFVSGSDVVTPTVVSEPTSSKPVYASWDSVNGIMTLSTPSVGKIFTGTDASSMFNIFVKLATIDLSNLGTDDATDLSSMFASCQCLTDLDVSVLNTSNVTNMKEMFRDVGYQSHPDHISFGGSFSMEKVTNAESMFAYCYVRSLDLSSISAPVLSDARGMFYECKDLTSLALPSVTSALTLIENTRYSPYRGFLEGCTILSNLDMTGFNARPVSVRKMFKNCSSLDTITIPDGFDTSNCSYWSELFSGCSSLQTVNFPSLNIQSSQVSNSDVATKMQNAFNGVTQCLVYCRTDLSGAWYPDTAFSNGHIWPGFQAHWQLTQGTLVPDWSSYNVYFVYTNK